jgi:hypothetical protein
MPVVVLAPESMRSPSSVNLILGVYLVMLAYHFGSIAYL